MPSSGRSEIRRRAQELEARHDRQLRALGRLALDMHRRDKIDSELLTERAVQIAEIEKDLGRLHVTLAREGEQGPAEPPQAGT